MALIGAMQGAWPTSRCVFGEVVGAARMPLAAPPHADIAGCPHALLAVWLSLGASSAPLPPPLTERV